MMNEPIPVVASAVTRVERADSAQPHGKPLVKLHLLLYGRYKWALLLGLILGISGAVAVWYRMPPKYQVIGYIRVKPYIPPVLSATDQNGILPMFETFVSLQVSLLQSQRVLDQASQNPEWKALGQNSPRWGSKIPADAVTVDHPKGSEVVTVAMTDRNPAVAAVAVKTILKAYQTTSGDTDGANNAERLRVLEDLRTSLTNQKRALGDQILTLANEYGSDDLAGRYQFKLEEQNKLESELQQVALDISVAQAAAGPESSATQATASAPASQPGTAPATKPATVTREDVARIDPQMRDLLADNSRLTLRLNQLRQRFGENYPDYQSVQMDLQSVEAQITSLLATYQERASAAGSPFPVGALGTGTNRLSLAELRTREANIRTLFEKVQTETKTLGQQNLKIRKLKDDQDAISKKLDETASRIDQLNLEATMSNRISILSYGESPTAPLPNRRLPMALAMGMLGMAAGAALVSLRGLADRRVSSLMHMQQLAPAIRVLGMLPVLPDDLTDPDQISLAAHCVHQIRNLLDAVPHDKGRALAVTSPSAGDGKTSLTLALGLSFAASGSRTLLIDCDLVGGGLTRRLNSSARRRIGSILQRQGLLTEKQVKEALRVASGTDKKLGEVLVELGYLREADVTRALADQQETSVGLLEALNGEPLAACVAPAVSEGLFVLPLGRNSHDFNGQVSTKELRRLIKDARSQFDLIIIDTGPILGSVEASVVAHEADEVVLAIARGASAPLVTRTVELLASVRAHLGGIVFNRATPGDVAYSNYGSIASLRSLRSTEEHRRSEPARPNGSPPRLGPVAAAVANGQGGAGHEGSSNGNGVSRKNGSAVSTAATPTNGSAPSNGINSARGAAPEPKDP